jgi:hypothetical protein
MAAIDWSRQTTAFEAAELQRMIGPDPHRPGAARARLIAEQIPVWALIGHLGALAGTTDPAAVTGEVIAQIAIDYAITPKAVLAAMLYYWQHRPAIDALLEANASALA